MLPLLYLWILCSLLLSFVVSNADTDTGGWVTDYNAVIASEGPCNIEVRDAESLSQFEFLERYAFDAPVVIKNLAHNKIADSRIERVKDLTSMATINIKKFSELSRRDALLGEFGDRKITLSTANTHSYDKVDVRLSHYIEHMLQPQSVTALGNETLYWFGDNNHTEWGALFNTYKAPPFTLPQKTGAYSFGVAGAGTGVPFHFHGPGFAEVIYGRKRWFLYPPDQQPMFHPNRTTLQWLVEDYPSIKDQLNLYECTVGPNEAIYFPDRWWHGTLNIDTSVFISTFLG